MQYMLIEYTAYVEGRGYMEILDGVCLRLTDMTGNAVTSEPVEYHIIDVNPPPPEWVAL